MKKMILPAPLSLPTPNAVRIAAGMFLLCLLLNQTLVGAPQDRPAEADEDKAGATIKGRIVQSDEPKFKIPLERLKSTFVQQVQLPQPTLPKEWQTMEFEARRKWFDEFEASPEGQALIERRKKIIEEAPRFELQLDAGGSFVIYDVPPGVYGLRGGWEHTIDDGKYLFEVFGRVEVADDVDEVLLDANPVNITRILAAGDQLPSVDIPTFDDQNRIRDNMLRGKQVLLSFWSINSPPSIEYARIVQEQCKLVTAKHDLQLLWVCLHSDRKKAWDHVKESGILGWHGFGGEQNDAIVREFGVNSIPALCLVDGQGKIMLTPRDFRLAANVDGSKLSQIISDRLEGKNPVPVIPAADQNQ